MRRYAKKPDVNTYIRTSISCWHGDISSRDNNLHVHYDTVKPPLTATILQWSPLNNRYFFPSQQIVHTFTVILTSLQLLPLSTTAKPTKACPKPPKKPLHNDQQVFIHDSLTNGVYQNPCYRYIAKGHKL